MPPKRGRAASEAEDETVQLRRHKSATEEAFAELVCPITFSLPVDPVMAEDGKVYERSAIEEYLNKQHKSPWTNLPMGTNLLPALQIKNMIRTMVTSGTLTGDKVDEWKLKLDGEKQSARAIVAALYEATRAKVAADLDDLVANSHLDRAQACTLLLERHRAAELGEAAPYEVTMAKSNRAMPVAHTPPPPAAPVSARLSFAAAAFRARAHSLFAGNVASGQERNAAAAAALQQAQAEQGSLASSLVTTSSKDVEMAW